MIRNHIRTQKWTPHFGQPEKRRSGYAAFRRSVNPKSVDNTSKSDLASLGK